MDVKVWKLDYCCKQHNQKMPKGKVDEQATETDFDWISIGLPSNAAIDLPGMPFVDDGVVEWFQPLELSSIWKNQVMIPTEKDNRTTTKSPKLFISSDSSWCDYL